MASVGRYGKGYSIRYWYETETGEYKQKRVCGFKTKEEAWAAAKSLEMKSSAGIEVNIKNMTCGEVMERWFAEHVPGLAPTTVAKYNDGIDKLERYFVSELPVKKLNQARFNLLIEQLTKDVALSTAVSNTEPLRLSLSWAAAQGIIPVNPLASVKLPNVPNKLQVILSDDDVDELVAAATSPARRCTDYRIPLLLVLYGGLRREECAGLRWEKVDFKKNRITISEAVVMTPDGKEHIKDPKTKLSSRTISLPRFVMDELETEYAKFLSRSDEYIMKNNPAHRVCVTSTGEPYSLKSYSHPLKRLIREINAQREADKKPRMPSPSFHDLRHTHAAMLIRRNVQPKIIQERLGHASIKITMDLYGYLMPGLQDSVAVLFDDEKKPPNLRAVK